LNTDHSDDHVNVKCKVSGHRIVTVNPGTDKKSRLCSKRARKSLLAG